MTACLNRVMLIGRVAGSIELHTVPATGKPIARFTVVTAERWKDSGTGERMERVEYHRVVVRNDNLARLAERLLSKGMSVYVEGRNETRSYVTQGERRTITEVVLNRHKSTLEVLQPRTSDAELLDAAPGYEEPWE